MGWITAKNNIKSERPQCFVKEFSLQGNVVKAVLYCTALGIYSATLNKERIGAYYLTPGFTSYHKQIQQQEYDVTAQLKSGKNELAFTLSGGWAVGTFGLQKKGKNYFDRLALLFNLKIVYADGRTEEIRSDKSCCVCYNQYIRAGIYEGEVYDAAQDISYECAAQEIELPFSPEITPTVAPVVAHEQLKPVRSFASKRGYIYDFGQNFAGIVEAKLKAKEGQKITFYHAEVLKNGKLYRRPLRSAKARIIYIAKEGEQSYEPLHTYMGFRYVEVIGISPENITLKAKALYSDIKEIGGFSCSDEMLNKLQNCIRWGAKSNFVDIPTDCPQRDERMGWTADTAVFARTACFNFSMNEFYRKWLRSMRDDQGESGQIPDTVPRVHFDNSRSAPVWADACAIVPWAAYLASGDKKILEEQYSCIKKYIADGLTHLTDFVWDKGFQYGDWCAPDVGYKEWQRRGKYVGTCYFANTVKTAEKIAILLNKQSEAEEYRVLFENISQGYIRRFVKDDGKIIDEFQSAYVLPLYFGMAGKYRDAFAANLARLVRENNYRLSTGFAGTPYLLFALCDNSYADIAYKLLLQDACPSWLYEVKMGATTMWERWNAIKSNGKISMSGMVSFNHYAYGSVGDFLYRRVLGLEAVESGYKSFIVKPIVGGGLTYAKGGTMTPNGEINVEWHIADGQFSITVQVPESTNCNLVMPSGKEYALTSGQHNFKE